MTKTLFPSLETFRTSFEPYTIGFEEQFEILRELADKASKLPTYPPYNIKQIKDNKYVIEMAVAGFAKAFFAIERLSFDIYSASLDAAHTP